MSAQPGAEARLSSCKKEFKSWIDAGKQREFIEKEVQAKLGVETPQRKS